MTARLFTLNPVEGFRPKTFAGHKDAVLGSYFSADGSTVRTQLKRVKQCVTLSIFKDIHSE